MSELIAEKDRMITSDSINLGKISKRPCIIIIEGEPAPDHRFPGGQGRSDGSDNRCNGFGICCAVKAAVTAESVTGFQQMDMAVMETRIRHESMEIKNLCTTVRGRVDIGCLNYPVPDKQVLYRVVRICVDSTVHDDDNAIVGHSEKYTISSQDAESDCYNTKKNLPSGRNSHQYLLMGLPSQTGRDTGNRELCDTGNVRMND